MNEKDAADAVKVEYFEDILNSKFTIEEGIEDVHSQVEYLLTQRIGEAGKNS